MNIYRFKLRLTDGQRAAYTGLFADGCEAVLHALSYWPGARSVTAICLRRTDK